MGHPYFRKTSHLFCLIWKLFLGQYHDPADEPVAPAMIDVEIDQDFSIGPPFCTIHAEKAHFPKIC